MKRYIQADIIDVSDEDYIFRIDLASNPSTRPDTLRKLSKDQKWVIRAEVGCNPNTPEDILSMLAEDPCADVRVCVAQNKNTPESMLRVLTGDIDWFTRQEAMKNLYRNLGISQ